MTVDRPIEPSNEEVIAEQARRLMSYEKSEADYKARLRAIRMIIIGVGGPLNDNKLHYTNAQLHTFGKILEQTDE